ncbi:hypothetical protein [Leifsonia sp. Leaf264]|uniref:hypothetical protein n=1 Tax=Leifsonia sp. Leaf264 TaxID=1736314 RepID=UPI000A6FD601|nr:hypothetical protein [Leifsonia sp. Leaf264]
MPQRRTPSLLWAIAGCVLSLLLGCVVVRLGLDAVDTRPYSASSEVLYLVVAVAALVVWLGGSAATILLWRRRRLRP